MREVGTPRIEVGAFFNKWRREEAVKDVFREKFALRVEKNGTIRYINNSITEIEIKNGEVIIHFESMTWVLKNDGEKIHHTIDNNEVDSVEFLFY